MNRLLKNGLCPVKKKDAIAASTLYTDEEKKKLRAGWDKMDPKEQKEYLAKAITHLYEKSLGIGDMEKFIRYWGNDHLQDVPTIFHRYLKVKIFKDVPVIVLSMQEDIPTDIWGHATKQEIKNIEKEIPGIQLKMIFQKERGLMELWDFFLEIMRQNPQEFKEDRLYAQDRDQLFLTSVVEELKAELNK